MSVPRQNTDSSASSSPAACPPPSEETDCRQQRVAELVIRNQQALFRYVCSIVPHRADAEELVQETNLAILRSWESFDQEREFVPWAFGIARNCIRNFLRKKERRHASFSEELMEQLTKTRLKHEDLLERHIRALPGCLEKLDVKQRRLLDRCYTASTSIKGVADSIGETCNAVYKRLRRIRLTLHQCITQSLVREGSS